MQSTAYLLFLAETKEICTSLQQYDGENLSELDKILILQAKGSLLDSNTIIGGIRTGRQKNLSQRIVATGTEMKKGTLWWSCTLIPVTNLKRKQIKKQNFEAG